MTEHTNKLYTAIADFQREVPAINKDSKGYGYSYASLDTIIETITPKLKEHKLGYTQLVTRTEDNTPILQTILFHSETGENISSDTVIPQEVELKGMNPFQVLGSGITYLRRYALSAMLGLVTDSDTDASAPHQNKQKQPESKPDTSDVGNLDL